MVVARSPGPEATVRTVLRAYRADAAFDGSAPVPGGAVVLVDDGTIVGVEPAGAHLPDACELVYEPGTTLLPGLIDTHVHLCADGGPQALAQLGDLTDDELDAIVSGSLDLQLTAGVTTVRDLGDARWAVVDRHRHRGRRAGPTVLAAGPPITIPGGHCWNMGGQAQGREGLRQAVAARVEHGVDVVKVMASGGVMTPGTDVFAPAFELDDLRFLVETAHASGLAVTAHAHALAAVEIAVEAGVDGLEHCSCLSPTGPLKPPALLEAIAGAGIAVCPTLGHVPGMEPPPQLLAVMERMGVTIAGLIRHGGELVQAGLRIVSGSDAGIGPAKPHGILPQSLIDLVEGGADPVTALASATSVAADACGVGSRTGRLRAGLDADLLIVAGNPATRIADLLDVRLVVSKGNERRP